MPRMLVSLILSLILLPASVHAADIIKVKGASVLIDLKGATTKVGDQFFVLANGKKVAMLRVRKISGDKAIAHISKGKAEVGMTLEAKVDRTNPRSNKGLRSSPSDSEYYWGAIGGYAMDTMKVKVLWQRAGVGHAKGDQKEVASITGTGFSAKGLMDFDVGPIALRALSGVETYDVAGSNSCGAGNDEACTSKIVYLTVDGLARYRFMQDNVRPWVGLGLSLLFPVSASGTALDPASVGSTWMGIAAAGVDWFINPRMYFPISLEYGMFPPTDQVNASWIQLRAGFAIPY